MVSDGESSSIGFVRSVANYRTIIETPPSPSAAAAPPTKLLAANGEFEEEFFLVRWWCSPWRKRKGILIPICGILLVVFAASFSWSSEDGGRVRVRPLWWKNTNRSKKGDVDGGMWTIQDGNTELSTTPAWVWDHYLYNPQNSTTSSSAAKSSSDNRNLLIAQVVSAPPRSTKHPPYKHHDKVAAAAALLLTQEELAEISSRPNRAYARQWGRNYLRYTAPLAPLLLLLRTTRMMTATATCSATMLVSITSSCSMPFSADSSLGKLIRATSRRKRIMMSRHHRHPGCPTTTHWCCYRPTRSLPILILIFSP